MSNTIAVKIPDIFVVIVALVKLILKLRGKKKGGGIVLEQQNEWICPSR